MTMQLRPPGVFEQTLLLAGREVSARVQSLWLYAVASAICLMAWAFGDSFLRSFETETVLVSHDPLLALNTAVVTLLAIVLGLRLASSFAWEREHRTLEVLLVGPVATETVILAKFLVEFGALVALTGVYFVYLLVAQPLGSGVIEIGYAATLGRLPLHTLPLLAFGLLVSTWARTMRGAIVIYIAAILVLGLFEIALRIMAGIPPSQLDLAASYLKAGLQGAAVVLDVISPLAPLMDLVDALPTQLPPPPSSTLLALGLTVLFLVLSALAARRRGAIA